MEVTKTVQKTLPGVLGYKSIEGLGVLGVYGVWGIGMWWFGSVDNEYFIEIRIQCIFNQSSMYISL